MTPEFFTPAWTPTWTAALINHLWQSTAVVFVAWLLTLSLRPIRARVRYAIWMIASIKFLFPFALLTSLGAHWATHNSAPQISPSLYVMVEEISQPFRQGRISNPSAAMLPFAQPPNSHRVHNSRRFVDLRVSGDACHLGCAMAPCRCNGAKRQGRYRWPGIPSSSSGRKKRKNQEADSAGLFTKRI